MKDVSEVFEVTRDQLEDWADANPFAFSISLNSTTNLVLVSAYRTPHGWMVEAESDANAIEHADANERQVLEELCDGYYEPLAFEVWRVKDLPVEGGRYEVGTDSLVRLEGVARAIEEIVCEGAGVWDLRRLRRSALAGPSPELYGSLRDLLILAMELRSIVGGIAGGVHPGGA